MDETKPAHFTIVHTDNQVVVVNKDAGLLTVPAHGQLCLVDLLEQHLDRQSYGRYRLAVIHRLDRQTSGLLVFARTLPAAANLAKQFAGQGIVREYVATVIGTVAEDAGTIKSRLDGKLSTTHFNVLRRDGETTTLAVQLETGRRNQIRRHFAERGQPVVGDDKFCPQLARHPSWTYPGLALHARLLGFSHPTSRQRLHFEAPLPPDFAAFCERPQRL